GKTDYDFFPRDEADFFTAKDQEVLGSGALLDIPEEPVHAPQGMRFHHTKKIPVTDESGRPLYLLGISRDVTARKQAEEQLREAREAAERASRAKSEFLATMSHEIRTPLTAVIGFAHLLQGTEMDERQRQYVEGLGRGGEMLLSVIYDILDFSKIEAGKLELEIDGFDPRRVVADTAGVASERAREKGLTVSAHCHPDVPFAVTGDAARLGQVLMNLMGNAIKFTDRGGVEVRVVPMPSSSETVRLRFEVQDTGLGIAVEDQAGLFDAFRQLDASPTRRHEGTGLGLAICKRLVELMGGDIGFESTPGEGSSFWFTAVFERVTDHRAAGRSENGWAAIPVHEDSQGRRRALLVEDNPANQLVQRHILERLGFDVAVVASGEQALEALEREAYAVVLMDCRMPAMDGYETTRRIRQREAPGRRTPIIAITASAMQSDRQRCLDAGMDDYLAKPVRPDELQRALERLSAGTTERATADAAPRPEPTPTPDGHVIDLRRWRSVALLGSARAELVDTYLEDAADRLDELRRAFGGARSDAAERILHTLKSSSELIGARHVASLCRKMERRCLEGNLAGARALMDDLEHQFDRVRAALAPFGDPVAR
ncbi:MAG: response regulator, partial [Actinomycetota bacterium]